MVLCCEQRKATLHSFFLIFVLTPFIQISCTLDYFSAQNCLGRSFSIPQLLYFKHLGRSGVEKKKKKTVSCSITTVRGEVKNILLGLALSYSICINIHGVGLALIL